MSNSTESYGTASEARNEVKSEAIYGTTNIAHIYAPLIQRSYEAPYSWYYVTFKPFNDSYQAHEQRYQNCLGIVSDYCRTKADLGILSRETISSKTHVNAILVSCNDLLRLHGTNITKRGLKYKLHVDLLLTYPDRHRVLMYMFKESKERQFILYTDHMSFITSQLKSCPERSDPPSDDPDQPVRLKRSLFNVCNNNKFKLII